MLIMPNLNQDLQTNQIVFLYNPDVYTWDRKMKLQKSFVYLKLISEQQTDESRQII